MDRFHYYRPRKRRTDMRKTCTTSFELARITKKRLKKIFSNSESACWAVSRILNYSQLYSLFCNPLVPTLYIWSIKISSVNFEKIEFFYFSKFFYNFCKNFFLKLLFGVNYFYNGTISSTTYELNPSWGRPTMLIRLRPLVKKSNFSYSAILWQILL